MSKRVTVNKRRLTRAQAQEIIDSGVTLREDMTAQFRGPADEWTTFYELPKDQFLIIDESGRGDIWFGDAARRLVRFALKCEEDAEAGRYSSVDHWRYYSKAKSNLVHQLDELIDGLARALDLPADALDRTYKSLDPISEQVEKRGIEWAQAEIYDNLVAYVGEVIRTRVQADWVIEDDSCAEAYPALLPATGRVLMPINVVHGELGGLAPVDLRKETVAERRRA